MKCNHELCSGPYRRLLTEEEYTPDGRPQVGNSDHYMCYECGATLNLYERGTSHPYGIPHPSWRMPKRLRG